MVCRTHMRVHNPGDLTWWSGAHRLHAEVPRRRLLMFVIRKVWDKTHETITHTTTIRQTRTIKQSTHHDKTSLRPLRFVIREGSKLWMAPGSERSSAAQTTTTTSTTSTTTTTTTNHNNDNNSNNDYNNTHNDSNNNCYNKTKKNNSNDNNSKHNSNNSSKLWIAPGSERLSVARASEGS